MIAFSRSRRAGAGTPQAPGALSIVGMFLTFGVEILEELAVETDEDTTSTLVTAQIGRDPTWRKPLVLRRLQPAHAARAPRFCAALDAWLRAAPGVFHVERGRDPFAIVEYVGPYTLAAFAGVALAPRLAEQIASSIDSRLRWLHRAGLAHGDVRAGCVALANSVELKVGRPWCERATPAEDLRRAAALRAGLIVARSGATSLDELRARCAR